MHTQFQAFSKKFFEKIYPFTCSHWEAPIYRVFIKNFLSGKIPLTYLELQSQMTPYFTEKMRKYFLVAGALFCLLWKLPSLIPTGRGRMHTLNLKNFLSLHLFGIEKPKRTLFLQKFWKIFFRLRALILLAQKVPSLIPTGKRQIPTLFQKMFCCLQNPFTYLELGG